MKYLNKGQSTIPTLSHNGQEANDDLDEANMLNTFFADCFNTRLAPLSASVMDSSNHDCPAWKLLALITPLGECSRKQQRVSPSKLPWSLTWASKQVSFHILETVIHCTNSKDLWNCQSQRDYWSIITSYTMFRREVISRYWQNNQEYCRNSHYYSRNH